VSAHSRSVWRRAMANPGWSKTNPAADKVAGFADHRRQRAGKGGLTVKQNSRSNAEAQMVNPAQTPLG